MRVVFCIFIVTALPKLDCRATELELVSDRPALSLALKSLSSEQQQALQYVTASYSGPVTVLARRIGGKNSKFQSIRMPLRNYIEDINRILRKASNSEASSSLVHLNQMNFSFTFGGDGTGQFGGSIAIHDITFSSEVAMGQTKVFDPMITSIGHGIKLGWFEKVTQSESARESFSAAAYRAVLLAILLAADLTEVEQAREVGWGSKKTSRLEGLLPNDR